MYKQFLFSILICTLLHSCKEKQKDAVITSEISEKETSEALSIIENPSGVHSHLPRLFSTGEALYFSWIKSKDSLDVLNFSVWKDGTWQPTTEVAKGADWFTNWADFPAIAANKQGDILISYLQKSDTATYSYDIKLNIYNANSNTWKKHFLLHNDNTKTEHGFVSMTPIRNGNFEVAWLDGRNTKSIGGHGHDSNHGSSGAMTLRTAVVSNDGEVINSKQLDDKVCDCCQTAIVSTFRGPLIAYRDRSDSEIRDVSVAASLIHNMTTTKTIGNDNWKINGCPVNGPSIDAFGDTVAVVWYTAANDIAKVQVSFSENAGRTYGLPMTIHINEPLGRVDVAMISATEAVVSWMETVNKKTMIMVRKVSIDGTMGEALKISETSASRASGFPQMELVGNLLYFAWTDTSKEKKEIKMATLAIDKL